MSSSSSPVKFPIYNHFYTIGLDSGYPRNLYCSLDVFKMHLEPFHHRVSVWSSREDVKYIRFVSNFYFVK